MCILTVVCTSERRDGLWMKAICIFKTVLFIKMFCGEDLSNKRGQKYLSCLLFSQVILHVFYFVHLKHSLANTVRVSLYCTLHKPCLISAQMLFKIKTKQNNNRCTCDLHKIAEYFQVSLGFLFLDQQY